GSVLAGVRPPGGRRLGARTDGTTPSSTRVRRRLAVTAWANAAVPARVRRHLHGQRTRSPSGSWRNAFAPTSSLGISRSLVGGRQSGVRLIRTAGATHAWFRFLNSR